MGLINAVTRRRLELAQHRNWFLDHIAYLSRSTRYLSDEALRIDKSKLDDVGYALCPIHASQVFVDKLNSQKFIPRNRLTLTSTSHTKTGETSLLSVRRL